MKPAYRVKKPDFPYELRLEVCLGCGKEQSKEYPKGRPIANPTDTTAPSRLNCWMGLHNFVDISKVEFNK